MFYRSLKVLLIATSPAWLWPAAARAQLGAFRYAMLGQGPAMETVSGMGNVTIKPQPSALRMHIELVAKGKDLPEALAKLKDRREAAAAQLETLKANKGSITFGSPGLSQIQDAQRRQLEALIRQRMRSGKRVPKGLKAPKSVTVAMKLSAEWPLQADGPEGLLLAAQQIIEKVKAADLAGVGQAEKLSPEEEELADEITEPFGGMDEEKVEPGEPFFLYVARISDQQRDRAMAEAFAKAKLQAQQLARAAGIRLGPLTGLTGQGGGSSEVMASQFGGFGYARQQYLQRLIGQADFPGMDEKGNETASAQPDSLVFTFMVRASFGFQKPLPAKAQ